jgi:hypothetical protein
MFCGTLLLARLRGSRSSPQSDLVFGQPLHTLVGRYGEPAFDLLQIFTTVDSDVCFFGA